MRHGLSLLVTALVVMAYPMQGRCWGPVGHRTIGILAGEQLNPSAAAAVKSLLGPESLGDVANWADQVRGSGSYPQTTWYHFEKISDNTKYTDHLAHLSDSQRLKGGVVEAILMAAAALRDTSSGPNEKTDALKFLVHFVGDLHQPLHTGRPDDNGGVKIDVTWMGTPMNLHRIWDSGMIYSGHADILSAKSDVDASSAYANYLKSLKRQVDTSIDVEGWLNESMALRTAAYDQIYISDQKKYQDLHLGEIDQRIYAAGMRLANLLNQIFTNAPAAATEIQFRKDIEAITGDLRQFISFKK